MKKLKKNIAIILSSIMILGLTGCSGTKTEKAESDVQSSSKTNSHYPVTITTHNYKKEPIEITFDKEPENVVAVYQNSIETMLALGLEDKIKLAAGLDHDVKDEYKEAFSKVNYSEQFTPDKETVLMEQPDFILSWYSIFDDKRLGDVDYWNKNNINTYMSLNSGAAEDRTVENEITDILNLGKIFNVEDKAKKIADEINTKIDEVSKKVKGKKEQTTLIIEYMDGKIHTYGAKSLGGDMVTRLGGKILNPEGGSIGEEDLIKLNPDSIFVVYMDRGNKEVEQEEVNKILKNPALSSLNAVKNHRVNAMPLGDMYCSGIRTIDGINAFAKGLYPDLNK
ncbi:ABC transporter substrate-binding protein [Romboutsia sp. 1001713B170131_170501_G6]|uniref:ABC transporter substrate-binding protein n=1 Tax=Romboutsia sp. 1001713B170131_170501_G6 TaxID=2787108 RepID=UPI0018AC7BA7|nr:ABC transporter substrate-binding protein [Romboutsia sp. 1001713B170131_170501_G6]